jgi:hypothetical protein
LSEQNLAKVCARGDELGKVERLHSLPKTSEVG